MFSTSLRGEESARFSNSQCHQRQPVSIHHIENNGGLFRAAGCSGPNQGPSYSQYLPVPKSGVQFSQHFRTTSPTSMKRSWDEISDQRESVRNARVSSSLPFSHTQWIQYLPDGRYVSDEEAATNIEKWFHRRRKRRHGQLACRILRDLITRREDLDNHSLNNLLLAADKIIFDCKLSGRVSWRWSRSHERQYEHDLLGTTTLRPAPPAVGGFLTQIVLSKPLLQNQEFNRDLLLSAFFHEMVHCYLFIQCGLEHALHDGHTPGFQKIASLIDKWFGYQRLHLCNMRANLDHFRVPEEKDCKDPSATVDEGYGSRVMSPEYVEIEDYKMLCGVRENAMMQEIIWYERSDTLEEGKFANCHSSPSWC